MRALAPIVLILGSLVSRAHAQKPTAATAATSTANLAPSDDDGEATELDYVVVPPSRRTAGLARTIFLDPCRGGCAVDNKRNDPDRNQSTIVKTPGTLTEFPFGDAAWAEMVQCVKHAYEFYDVTVTTEPPPPGVDYVKVLVAGLPTSLGFTSSTLGISPLATDCSPLHNVVSFAFAGAHNADHLSELCATVTHEAGHSFGLDHALQCRDPMTYLVACGDKLFLNIESTCGEFKKKRFCRCSDTQNSHVKLLNELGPSGRPGSPGEVNIEAPTAMWNGSQVIGSINEHRWIRSIELWINGFRWEKLGHQLVTNFRFNAPPELSNGILEVEVRSVNDLGVVAVDRLSTVKGVACQTSSSCQAPEVCDEGRCMYPAPTGQLGQVCTAAKECASWECTAFAGADRCASLCSVGAIASECPANFTCVAAAEDGGGMCWPTSELPEAGCCGANSRPPSPLAILLGLGFFWRYRRSRRR
jgi:hypothetical protein